MSPGRFLPTAAVAAALLVAKLAPASPEADSTVRALTAAEETFARGTEAFERGDFAAAYELHRSAWDQHRSFKTAVGLGQVELYLGKHRDAAEHLTFALDHAPPDMPGELREKIEFGVAEARAHVGVLRLSVDVEGATVSIDGVEVGVTPLEGVLFLEPGVHEVRATAAGRRPASVEVTVVKKGVRELSLQLPPEPGRAERASPAPDHTPAWVALGVGGGLTIAALTTAIVFNAKGNAAQSDVDALRRDLAGAPRDACAEPTGDHRRTCDALSEAASDRNQSNRIATVSFVTASVLGALTAGATYLLWPRGDVEKERASRRVRVDVGASGVFVSGAF